MSVRVRIYVVLLHYPMTNRRGELVTTAVTNMDIHDIARSCRTFGVSRYFMVTPIEDQRRMVARILAHWATDRSREYHPDRVEAVSRVSVVEAFDQVKAEIQAECGEAPEVVFTDARPLPALSERIGPPLGYAEYRAELAAPNRTRPAAIVFGTGWGVAEAFHPEVHRILAPVHGPERLEEGTRGYNHLSVRSAAAIILDRLFGR